MGPPIIDPPRSLRRTTLGTRLVTLLVALDLSAFDTIGQNILPNRLATKFGVEGSCFKAVLLSQRQITATLCAWGGLRKVRLKFGSATGLMIWDPLLYTMYAS